MGSILAGKEDENPAELGFNLFQDEEEVGCTCIPEEQYADTRRNSDVPEDARMEHVDSKLGESWKQKDISSRSDKDEGNERRNFDAPARPCANAFRTKSRESESKWRKATLVTNGRSARRQHAKEQNYAPLTSSMKSSWSLKSRGHCRSKCRSRVWMSESYKERRGGGEGHKPAHLSANMVFVCLRGSSRPREDLWKKLKVAVRAKAATNRGRQKSASTLTRRTLFSTHQSRLTRRRVRMKPAKPIQDAATGFGGCKGRRSAHKRHAIQKENIPSLHQEHFIGRFQPQNRRARKDERATGGPASVLEGRNLMEATSNYVLLFFVKVLSGRERLPASSKMAVGAKIAIGRRRWRSATTATPRKVPFHTYLDHSTRQRISTRSSRVERRIWQSPARVLDASKERQLAYLRCRNRSYCVPFALWATFLRCRQPEYDPRCERERVAKGPSDQQSELEYRKPRDSSLNNAVVFFRSVLAGRRDLSVLSKVAVEAKFAGKDDRRRHEKPTRRSQGEHVTLQISDIRNDKRKPDVNANTDAALTLLERPDSPSKANASLSFNMPHSSRYYGHPPICIRLSLRPRTPKPSPPAPSRDAPDSARLKAGTRNVSKLLGIAFCPYSYEHFAVFVFLVPFANFPLLSTSYPFFPY
ncbi:hypothetical protein M408DRAFT_11176 [Serendipita vermifera MAFF 305830]|uniref:Uncharacterized protein n=1 Tax=Serendipita vermifera MAFF 305830 TaxID=933852 RepID=A0A0C2WC37_SERVB|nr:hypothetical protein M408DRAFT_11176 [Serendipita vermifera MAFF 305830]